MKKIGATLRLAGFVLVSLIFCSIVVAQQPPYNIEGNWTIYSTSIATGETVVKHVQIAQYGNQLSGFFEGPEQSGPIQGSINGQHVEFKTKTRNVLTFRGNVNGNTMAGLYGIHGRHAGWQAVQTTGVGLAAAPVATVTTYQYQPVQTVQAPTVQAPAEPAPQAAPQLATTATAQGSSGPTPAPQSADQLNALVAPIALYPDALVAQILAASTFPDQVAIADYWLHQNSNLTGGALAQAVDQQSWDPSVKALTQFLSVLDDLAKNLAWTSSLGQAFQNQQADVMAAVQAMRAKAQAAGTLQSNAQITVTQATPGTIVIQPASPQVVYIPQYNPTIVYGAPIVVPLYTPPVVFAAPALTFGAGVAVFGGGGGAFAVGGGFGWGFHAWACNWGGGGGGSTIIFNHSTYINNNTYNGYHPWGPGPHGAGPYGPNGYHPGTDTHYGPNGGYHPNGYFGPNGGFHHDVPGTGPAHMPNGGANGNHGLIGGNGGVQNPNAGRNGPGVAPAGGYSNGMNNTGGLQQRTASNNLAATNREPNSLGASRPGTNGPGAERSNEGSFGDRSWNQNNSRMSGNGATSRAESNRGRSSMAGRRPQQRMVRQQHMGGERHFGGGGGGRRR
ncbi:MAG: DUF3300 domain-containing protein [Candidatus Acidiferrum sp.]